MRFVDGRSTRALLLVGHGSSFNGDSSAPIYEHAARIRRRRSFDQVHVAFWKEQPYLRDALPRITTEQVFVVPMFMADGYFTRTIVPRELGSSPRMQLCPPIGVHASMPRLVLKRAASTSVDPLHAELIVIGHGTERSATSSETVHVITRSLRQSAGFQRVRCGFLDQEPRIERVVADSAAAHVVLVPFLMADGYHTRETIPGILGLDGALTMRGARALWYTAAVGTLPDIACVAVEVAGLAVRPPPPASSVQGVPDRVPGAQTVDLQPLVINQAAPEVGVHARLWLRPDAVQ